MPGNFQVPHRPGPYKAKSKAHKAGHRSKRELHSIRKVCIVKRPTPRDVRDIRKEDALRSLRQRRRLQTQKVLEQKRQLGGAYTPPYNVAIVGVHAGARVDHVLEALCNCDPDAVVAISPSGYTNLGSKRFKKRYCFIPAPQDPYGILDVGKIADVVLFVYDSENIIDEEGDLISTALISQGISCAMHVITSIDDLDMRQSNERKKIIAKAMSSKFPDMKLVYLPEKQTSHQEAVLLLRHIAEVNKKELNYRDKRCYISADEIDFEQTEGSDVGTLKITGFLRGNRILNANNLVHIVGCGDFQMSRVDISDRDPYPLNTNGRDEQQVSWKTFQECNPAQQVPLDAENVPDDMDSEQTWPTAEELAASEEEQRKKSVKRVPKGTSEYQAAWIEDADSDEDDDDEEESVHDENMEEAREETEDSGDEGTVSMYDDDTMSEAAPSVYDATYDPEEEAKMLKDFREHCRFPDEVDTPMDIPAKVRFARYRGLKSFRTSPWHPYENLPSDYGRIYMFRNFDHMRKRVFKEKMDDADEGAFPGSYLCVHVKNFPQNMLPRADAGPTILVGLLQHEHRMSLLNVAIKRYTQPDASVLTIKNKERLIFQVGFRRFYNEPIFSQHTVGSKHKMERFLSPDGVSVASMYAPITYPPAPVLVFKDSGSSGAQRLVATGSVLSVDPKRLVIKKIVISGHPYKINRRSAVIRYMFFNADDVNWFKPITLWTKSGFRGHIKESLGTHGYMKCVFNRQLRSQDTVLMDLFKRVYPKWRYDPYVKRPNVFKTGPSGMANLNSKDEQEEDMH